jgi:hypothetical protein
MMSSIIARSALSVNFNLPALNDVGNETGKEEVNDGAVTSVSLPLIRSAPSDNVAVMTF